MGLKGEEIKRHWDVAPSLKVQQLRPRGFRYYAKLSFFYFLIGAGLEVLMIASGFYKQDINTPEDLEKALKKHEHRKIFYEELQKQAKEKYEEKTGKSIETARPHKDE